MHCPECAGLFVRTKYDSLKTLSTVETAFFIAGAFTAAGYFTRENKEEAEIRQLAESLYQPLDWAWALNGGVTICHGWKPESGFLPYRWNCGYNEVLLRGRRISCLDLNL